MFGARHAFRHPVVTPFARVTSRRAGRAWTRPRYSRVAKSVVPAVLPAAVTRTLTR
jgi:hypothetical protein